MRKPMTLDEIKASSETILYPVEVSGVLQMDPQEIRDRAREAPETLGFRTIIAGKKSPHVKIPRLAFLAYIEGR